jgi:hypothetical protein
MTGRQYSLASSPFSQLAWPANGCVALVLDGASIPHIDKSIYEWSGGAVEAECLYASTRWESVSEFAPWLVWLSSDNDPVVQQFLEEGAGKEWGYFLVSEHGPDVLGNYLRQLLVIERSPGCVELVRIAHPELARSIIGKGQVCPGPGLPPNVVHQIISPDLVSGAWVVQEPPQRPEVVDGRELPGDREPLDETFSAFNRRRDSLALWELMEQPVREWLGGQSLPLAFSKLSQLTVQAEQKGHPSPREKMRYLVELYHRDRQARIDDSRAHTFMDEQ